MCSHTLWMHIMLVERHIHSGQFYLLAAMRICISCCSCHKSLHQLRLCNVSNFGWDDTTIKLEYLLLHWCLRDPIQEFPEFATASWCLLLRVCCLVIVIHVCKLLYNQSGIWSVWLQKQNTMLSSHILLHTLAPFIRQLSILDKSAWTIHLTIRRESLSFVFVQDLLSQFRSHRLPFCTFLCLFEMDDVIIHEIVSICHVCKLGE